MFLEKKKSRIHGFGIFTKKKIIKGETIHKVLLDKVFNAPKPRLAHIGNGICVSDPVLNWFNHSCNPNAVLDISKKDPVIVATRDIEAGEEITCDYDLTEIGGVRTACNCHSHNCRKYFLKRE